MNPELVIVRYDTLRECLAAYLCCECDKVEDQEGIWQWSDAHGTHHESSMKDAIALILQDLVWGWVEDKHILHVWTSDQATPEHILNMLAHEMGHTRRPWHRDTFLEEQKACGHALVAVTAFQIMNEFLEEDRAKA